MTLFLLFYSHFLLYNKDNKLGFLTIFINKLHDIHDDIMELCNRIMNSDKWNIKIMNFIKYILLLYGKTVFEVGVFYF